MTSQNQLQHDDIIKMGVLKTGKKGKRRFCVLRQDSYNAPARLDCYESEKRFRQFSIPKTSIKLKDVFNINKTAYDGKLKFCIGIYAWSATLALGCENCQDQEAWLYTLLNVYNSAKSGTSEEDSRCMFDYCWDVSVMEKGLADKSDKRTPQLRGGEYRLCLTSCSIFLYQKSSPSEACIEFPLVCISNYGHKTDVFYLRVGRSAITGQGELWMQTDDACVAQSIHENMKRILDENHEYRQRSSSLTEEKRQNLRGNLSHSRGAYTSNSAEKLSTHSGSFTGKFSTYSNHHLTNSPVTGFYTGQAARRRNSDDTSSSVLNTSPTNLPADHEAVKSSAGAQRRQSLSERTSSVEYVSSQPTIIEEACNGGGDYLPMQPALTCSTTNFCQPIDEYTPMGPISQCTSVASYARPCLQRKKSWNLEEVRSYISDSNDSNASSSVDLNLSAVKMASSSVSPPARSSGMTSSWLMSRIAHGLSNNPPNGCITTINSVAEDDRQRAHSFGSWNKHQITRKHSSNLVSQLKEKDDTFRQRSESFGSSPPTNKVLSRLFGRFNNSASKRSNRSEDLVEMDFGPSYSSRGHSLSGSLSSSESLFRSRTNSFNTGAATTNNNSNAAVTSSGNGNGGRQSWSPKIEQIVESVDSTPTARLIQAERLCRNAGVDYLPMNCAAPGGDYVVMNSRRRSSADEKDPSGVGDVCTEYVGTFDVHRYVDASSGYSSTGDCSELGQQQQQTFPNDNFKPDKILFNVKPSCRLADFADEVETSRHRCAASPLSIVASASAPSIAYCQRRRNETNNFDDSKNSIFINNNRSPSSVSSVTPTPSPLGSAVFVVSSNAVVDATNVISSPQPFGVAASCRRTPSPKQQQSLLLADLQLMQSKALAVARGANLMCGSDETGNKSDVIYSPMDMSKLEKNIPEVMASN